jgi:hypothetical protein
LSLACEFDHNGQCADCKAEKHKFDGHDRIANSERERSENTSFWLVSRYAASREQAMADFKAAWERKP